MSFIETERLALRTWMPGDAEEARAIYADPEVMLYAPNGAVAPAAIPALIERFMVASERVDSGVWPAILKSDRRIIGAFGLAPEPLGGHEISWALARSEWGKGYAFEAARAVLDYAFSHVAAERVIALVHRENARSIALAHRLTMRFDRVVRARHRDLLRYAIDRPEKR